ncbi:MAG: amidohydrolase family protein, partial [Rubripirellula sp.]
LTTPPSNYAATEGQLSLVTFAEVFGLNQERAEERFAAADTHCQLEGEAGISPHAPYSTSIEMIMQCIAYARDQRRPLAMHVAESPAERELLFEGSGPFVAALKSIGAWRDGLFPWGGCDFVDLIDHLSSIPRSLLIHGNDLTKNEIEQLAAYPQVTPVYCPRTHLYFGYECHPVQLMLSMGIRVALGTDSRASNPDLNVWREVQYLLRRRQDIVPHDVLQMATQNGAIALGRNDLGTLDVGSQARLGVVRTVAGDLQKLYEDLSVNDFRVLDLSDD